MRALAKPLREAYRVLVKGLLARSPPRPSNFALHGSRMLTERAYSQLARELQQPQVGADGARGCALHAAAQLRTARRIVQ
jgi:hypothetical protein